MALSVREQMARAHKRLRFVPPPRTPETRSELVKRWRENGEQHFHLSARPGGGGKRGQYRAWVVILRGKTAVCDSERCFRVRL